MVTKSSCPTARLTPLTQPPGEVTPPWIWAHADHPDGGVHVVCMVRPASSAAVATSMSGPELATVIGAPTVVWNGGSRHQPPNAPLGSGGGGGGARAGGACAWT